MDVMKKSATSDKTTSKMVNGSLENSDMLNLRRGVETVELDSPGSEVLPPIETPAVLADAASSQADDTADCATLGKSEESCDRSPGEDSSSSSTTVPPPPPTDELKVTLRRQLEEIFLQENFSKDKFLISQLDSDQYISLDIIMHLKQIECLTCDSDLILELLKELPNLQIDLANRKVRLASPRSTIILREVPQATPKKDIERLFDAVDCPRCVRCEFAGNENWYVTFLTEDDAHKAYNHLRENVQNFLGKPIKARIKTSNTFIPTSGKPTTDPTVAKFCPSPRGLDGQEVVSGHHHHHHPFSSQAPASYLPNYIVPQALHFYPDLIPTQLWTQKFVEPYNVSVCPDFLYTQPIYGYASTAQDGGGSYEGNPRQHKSTNSVHFRPGNHHYQHRSQGEYGGYHRYGSHNDSRPPPRFLRQQLAASMASAQEGSMDPPESPGFVGLSRDDRSPSENNSRDSKQTQTLASARPSSATADHQIPNGFVKGTTLANKSSPDDGYSSRGRRIPERRGGYRGGRRGRNGEEADKIVRGRHLESSLRSPKGSSRGGGGGGGSGAAEATVVQTFLLESSSFPPLSSISNASSMPTSSTGTSYVQAVANSPGPSVNSHQPPQQKLPQATTTQSTNSSSTASSITASELLVRQSATAKINCDSVNGSSEKSSKMPLVKLSYAQIAQRSKLAPFKSQDNECGGGESVPGGPCPKSDRIEKTSPSSQQQQQQQQQPQQQQTGWSKKKQHVMQGRKNGDNFKNQRNHHPHHLEDEGGEGEEDEGRCFNPARKGDLENERHPSERPTAKGSGTRPQPNSVEGRCREVDGKLVTGDGS